MHISSSNVTNSIFFLSYLSRSLADRWGSTVDFTTSFLHKLYGWIKNGHKVKNLTKNGEPLKYSWEPRRTFTMEEHMNYLKKGKTA